MYILWCIYKHILADALAKDTENVRKDVKMFLKTAKVLRKDIANATPWKFEGTFANYVPPTLLHLFCKHAIQGSHQVKSPSRIESINQSVSVLVQHFVCAYKSDRQFCGVSVSPSVTARLFPIIDE